MSRCIRVGRISKAHGIRGEVKILPYSRDPRALEGYPSLYLAPARGDEVMALDETPSSFRSLRVIRSRGGGKYAIVAFEGMTTRDQAEECVGLEIWVDADLLPEIEEDEFYWHELEGMTAVTEDGQTLGTVDVLFATGAHDILVIRDGDREYFVPARQEFVASIDRQRKVLVIRPIPGLLEMNIRGS